MVNKSPENTGNARNTDLIPGWGRSLGIGNGNPLQDSCLENSMDRGAWRATVHGVAMSRTQLSAHTHTHTHTHTCTHIYVNGHTLSVSEHLDCIHILAIANNGTMNIGVHIHFQLSVLVLFG